MESGIGVGEGKLKGAEKPRLRFGVELNGEWFFSPSVMGLFLMGERWGYIVILARDGG